MENKYHRRVCNRSSLGQKQINLTIFVLFDNAITFIYITEHFLFSIYSHVGLIDKILENRE